MTTEMRIKVILEAKAQGHDELRAALRMMKITADPILPWPSPKTGRYAASESSELSPLASKTKHIRGRLKAAGIKAKCRCFVACQVQYITVNPPTFEAEFSTEEQKLILNIADCNGLTLARGAAINREQMTYAKSATFEARA